MWILILITPPKWAIRRSGIAELSKYMYNEHPVKNKDLTYGKGGYASSNMTKTCHFNLFMESAKQRTKKMQSALCLFTKLGIVPIC